MRLFEDIERTYQGVATNMEGGFSFLNHSGRPAAERVRDLLEDWFQEYPDSYQEWLRHRIRSVGEYESTFFELFLYTLLSRHPADVDVEHDLEAEKRAPDFRVQFPGSEAPVSLEATLCWDASHADQDREKRQNDLCDYIEQQIDSSDFYVNFHQIHNPQEGGLPKRKFVAFLRRTLDHISVGEPWKNPNSPASLRLFPFREGDVEIVVSFKPRRQKLLIGGECAIIGLPPVNSTVGGPAPAVARTIRQKAGKYGEFDRPYVIGVNVLSPWPLIQCDILKALFGVWNLDLLQSKTEYPFPPVWYGPGGWQNTRVSAVLIGTVVPWNLGRAEFSLYHNPYAQHPCTDMPWRCHEVVVEGDNARYIKGETVGEILELPEWWPGQLFRDE